MVAICYVEAWEKLCIPMSAARSFPLSLRQAFRMGTQWVEQGYSQATDKDDRKKTKQKNKTNRTVCSCGLAANMETLRKDRMTLGSCLQCSFWWKESRKCKAECILHVGERTRANTSSMLLFVKRKTGFLTTAIIHLLPVRMLHHTHTKCSFFYKKHHGQWIVKYTIPSGTPIRLLWPSLVGKL